MLRGLMREGTGGASLEKVLAGGRVGDGGAIRGLIIRPYAMAVSYFIRGSRRSVSAIILRIKDIGRGN